MNPQHRQRMLILVAGTCMALLALDRFVLTPLTSSWKERSARISDLQQKLDKGQFLLDRRDTLEQRWKEVTQQALPSDGPAAENRVLNAVNNWAADSRLNVTSIKPRWVEDDTVGPRVEIRISGAGNLESVTRFLYAIETSPLPLRLEDVELRARDDSGRDISVDAVFSGLTSGKEAQQS